MDTSVVSYPTRGHWGDARWRGNTSGYIIKDLIEHYKPRVFCDPAIGSGTSCGVIKEVNEKGAGIEYYGLDLHSGFNLLRHNLADRIGGKRSCLTFFHPPYDSIIVYSGNQYPGAHRDDLSRCTDHWDYLTKTLVALRNIYDAQRPGGVYSVLIGDIKLDKKYYSIQSDLRQLAPGELEGYIIKIQHNCQSDSKQYSGKFTRIMHEYLISFRKPMRFFGLLDECLKVSNRLKRLSQANWKATIWSALLALGGKSTLPALYDYIASTDPDKVAEKVHWRDAIRRELQTHFTSVGRGVWALS